LELTLIELCQKSNTHQIIKNKSHVQGLKLASTTSGNAEYHSVTQGQHS